MDLPNKMDISLLLLGVLITLWIYWIWSRRDFYQFALNFPGCFGVPILGVFPRIGNIKNFFPRIAQMFEDCKSYTICIWMGLYPLVITAEPDLVEKILTSPDLLNKAKKFYTPIYNMFKGGIASSPGGVLVNTEVEWLHNRKMINPAFRNQVVVNFFPIFNRAKDSLNSRLNLLVDDEEHRLASVVQTVFIGVSAETTMGYKMKEDDKFTAQLIKNFKYLINKVAMQGHIYSFLNLDKFYHLNPRYNCYRIFLYYFANQVIKMRLDETAEQNNNSVPEELENENEEISIKKTPNIFIDQAIQLYQNDLFSWNDIICEAYTIASASFETTANAIFSSIVFLAMHADVQEHLFQEIVNAYPNKKFDVAQEDFQDLPYLDMFMNEVLRLAPAIPVIGRHAINETQIDKDLTLPKDMQIMISIYHLHRRKDIWGPDADKFDPDNFLPENVAKRHSHAYIPFSKGIRNCIAWRYALFAMKTIIAGLVRNYRFTTTFKYQDIWFLDKLSLRFLREPKIQLYRRD